MERYCEHKRHSGSFWAYVLIISGVLWLLSKSGWDINLPGIGHFFSNIVTWSTGATFPLLVIVLGIVLIAGRKFFGALLLVLIVMILIPHFLIIPGLLMVFFFPVLLIVIGIIILTKLF
ncbi:MAG: hypothetical protein JNL03_01935 [Prolixibacteraceae bacterium]|nr:hypothetical protein [Prolixibacteraceae bacterium]